MIHRSFGARLVCVAAFAVSIISAEHASACLTTTCAVKNDRPANCVRDIQTLCWLAGIPLQWREPCVSFSVDARGIPALGLGYAETEALVMSSFALWPTTACAEGFPSIAVQSVGPLECDKREYNPEGPNSNAVIFQSKHWPHDPSALGVTTVSFDVETGRIVDADIEVNLVGDRLDFLGAHFVVTHEAGHFFGIDHSAVPDAVMKAQTTGSDFEAPPVLTPDDINAICLAYPTFRPVGKCDFEPERGFSPVCGGDVEASCSVKPRALARPERSRNVKPELSVLLGALGAFVARVRIRRFQSKRLRKRPLASGATAATREARYG